MKKLIQVGIILLILAPCVIFVPSFFQKGGVDTINFLIIPLVIFICSCLYILPVSTFSKVEKLALIIVSSSTSLITSTTISYYFVAHMYSDKTWLLWEKKEKVIVNLFYFVIAILFIIFLVELYVRLMGSRAVYKKSDSVE